MLLVKTVLKKSPIHGLGVFAAEAIPAGTPVARYVAGLDFCFDHIVAQRLDEITKGFLERYAYRLPGRPETLYCSLDNTRFINHADDPNLDDSGPITIAARDIAAGEELTTNYDVLCEPVTIAS
jgi:hypothetical protein